MTDFVPLTKEVMVDMGNREHVPSKIVRTALYYLDKAKKAEARVAQLETKVSTLTAAIATPEVYAGVVTEALELDSASWIKRVRELEAEVVGLNKTIAESNMGFIEKLTKIRKADELCDAQREVIILRLKMKKLEKRQ